MLEASDFAAKLFAAPETQFFDPTTHVMLFATTMGHFDFLGFNAYTEAVYFSPTG